MAKFFIYLYFLFGIHFFVHAQEIHFSQITNHHLLINPANTGHIGSDMRLGSGYRSQGISISSPYITHSAWADMQRDFKNLDKSTIGLGILMYNDIAGESSLRNTSAYASASFVKGFNRYNTIRAALGFSLGMINRSLSLSELFFDSQWNGSFFDPDLPSDESIVNNSIAVPDFNFGSLIFWEINANTFSNFGIALHHINQPNLSFYGNNNRLAPKLVFHAQLKSRLSDKIQIDPGVYYAMQQGVDELVFGSNVLFVKHQLMLLAGLWYRYERDIIPHIGLIYKDFLLEFSYDINVSKLHHATNYRGGFEIAIVKTFYFKKKQNPCDDF